MINFLRKRWIYVSLIILLAAGLSVFFILRSKNSSGTTYKTANITKGTLTVSVSGSGNVIVDKSETVSPSISGQVYDLSVQYGDKVEKGQTLFKIKNDQLDVTVSQAYASYLQAKESVSTGEYNVSKAQSDQTTVNDDSKSTDSDKAAAAEKVRSAESSLELAKINQDNAYSNYKLQKKNADLRTVTAPIDGTITTLGIKNGDQLGSSSGSSSGSTSSSSSSSSASSSSSSIVIADLGSMKASVSINEVDATQVKADQKANMTFDAISGLTLTGKVERISTIGTETSGVVTYPATIIFDSIDEKVKPQMSLTATITTDVKQDVLMAPNAAVKTSGDTRYVQIMENGSPKQQDVEVGVSNDTYTEIKSGVKESDTVVTQTVSSSSSAKGATTATGNSSGLNLRSLSGGSGFSGGPPAGE